MSLAVPPPMSRHLDNLIDYIRYYDKDEAKLLREAYTRLYTDPDTLGTLLRLYREDIVNLGLKHLFVVAHYIDKPMSPGELKKKLLRDYERLVGEKTWEGVGVEELVDTLYINYYRRYLVEMILRSGLAPDYATADKFAVSLSIDNLTTPGEFLDEIADYLRRQLDLPLEVSASRGILKITFPWGDVIDVDLSKMRGKYFMWELETLVIGELAKHGYGRLKFKVGDVIGERWAKKVGDKYIVYPEGIEAQPYEDTVIAEIDTGERRYTFIVSDKIRVVAVDKRTGELYQDIWYDVTLPEMLSILALHFNMPIRDSEIIVEKLVEKGLISKEMYEPVRRALLYTYRTGHRIVPCKTLEVKTSSSVKTALLDYDNLKITGVMVENSGGLLKTYLDMKKYSYKSTGDYLIVEARAWRDPVVREFAEHVVLAGKYAVKPFYIHVLSEVVPDKVLIEYMTGKAYVFPGTNIHEAAVYGFQKDGYPFIVYRI